MPGGRHGKLGEFRGAVSSFFVENKNSDKRRRLCFLVFFFCCKAPDVDFFLIILPGLPWDLTQTEPYVARSRWFKQDPNGTLFREVHLASEMACQHRPNRCCFLAVCDLPPKARSIVVYESSESESASLAYRRPRGIYATLLKSIARTDHGNPAVPGGQSTRLGSRSRAAAVPKTRFFLNCAPPPHQTTKPSRGRLQIGVSKPRLFLFELDPERT